MIVELPQPSGHYALGGKAHGIEYRLIKPERPQTNGMVERFNSRISDVLVTQRYGSGEDL